ncbi:hypothetical protein [Rhodoplanes sp. SY1]|uniref:hypothetical protein n=1 Tax=Rhodoplanes sp. SY1 TaxID=3166646 RepID=UPI0038B46F87
MTEMIGCLTDIVLDPEFQSAVIPGRTAGANPESSGDDGDFGWIPGSPLCGAPE